MWGIFLTLVPVFGIMALGALAEGKRLLTDSGAVCMNQFVYWFGLPTMVFSLMSRTTLDEISLGVVVAGIVGMAITQALTMVLFRLGKFTWAESALAGLIGCFPNSGYMGIPVILLLFPHSPEAKVVAGIGAVLPIFSLVFTDVWLSVEHGGVQLRQLLKNVWQKIYSNPALWSVILGLMVGVGGLPVPEAVLQITHLLGNTAGPCALFCLGMSMVAQVRNWQGGIKLSLYAQTVSIVIKLFFCPAIVYFLALSLGVDGIKLAAITISCAMPSAVSCHILAMQRHVLEEDGVFAVFLSTALSFFTITLWMSLMQAVVLK